MTCSARVTKPERTSAVYKEALPCSTARIRSIPAPVSTLRVGRSLSSPDSPRKCWVNTRFQISTNRFSASSFAGPPSGPCSGPKSKKISVEGPQGPVSPISQKLSLSSRWILLGSRPTTSVQMPSASSSVTWHVTQRRSPSMPRTSVTNSQAHGIASALK
ncbi:unannotated protein [freshwater metagenome]|uniref:Unannotated protein n=1 Tax=freshwater metagenome TaxID=449393 RepID=A0A6J7H0N0_9ZZZZ